MSIVLLNTWDLSDFQKIFLCELLNRSLNLKTFTITKNMLGCVKKNAIIECINYQYDKLNDDGKKELDNIKCILNIK